MNRGLVRPVCLEDIEAIWDIEVASFSMPWSRKAFIGELRDNEYARYFCLELNGTIIGYMGLWLILDEGHITNVAIAPDYRGQGWGEYLMRYVMSAMKKEGMVRMTLEVRVTNNIAQALYRRLGFVTAGIRKGYYADNGDDALIMWAELGTEVTSS